MKDLTNWNPEDTQFWETSGKKIANRNLTISILAQGLGFVLWLIWGIIAVQMINLGFHFQPLQLFTLAAIAGLTGATLRIPSSFLIRIAGGGNTIFFTTLLLLIPAIGLGIALQNVHTPLWVFQLLALISGIGGGNFASSMSNISFFFPKRMQGLALGLNAGLGNSGVTVMQVVVPLAMMIPLGISGMHLVHDSGSIFGKIQTGAITYLPNAAYVWIPVLIIVLIFVYLKMNNIFTANVTPERESMGKAFGRILLMLIVPLIIAAIGLWFILPASAHGSGLDISKWIVLPIIIIATVFALRVMPKIGNLVKTQYGIFKFPNTWALTILYTMTFGSFIGFAAAFPLAIKVIFGFTHTVSASGVLINAPNPIGPSAFAYAWLGPFVGALIRPIGGWIADRIGGSIVTLIMSIVMIICAVFVGHYMKLAYHSTTPQDYFIPFLIGFLVLFAATGIGNGSVFRSAAVLFNIKQAGPVVGWISAVAAYGAFIVPKVIGEQIHARSPEDAMYGLAVFYFICIFVNIGFFLIKTKGRKFNP